jgi:HK97 family phage portal protein
MGMLQSLARLIVPRLKANPAGEGNWHPGPYTVNGGVIPAGSPWNFWQCDIDPCGYPSSSIVEACVWAYVRAIAQLPGYHRIELDNGGTETVTSSALARLLRSPNAYQTPSDFLVHLIRSLLLAGNSYWIAQRNDRFEVTALHWTDPRACRVREIMVQGQAFREIFYEIGDNPLFTFDSILGRTSLVVPARDVFHVKLACPRHPLVGETWLQALPTELAQTAAINSSITQAASNMRPAGLIQTDLNLTPAQVTELKARWAETSQNLATGGVPILTHGLKFQPLTMSAEDQQVIEQRKMNNAMVAAVFGVPAILLGMTDTGTAKSAEAVMAEWLAAGLGWLINHVEVALDQFVGLNANSIGAGREYTEFDTEVLLRSAFREKIEGLARGVQAGIYAPDEARYKIGYPKVAGGFGKMPRVQQQMVPLDFEPEPAKPAPAPALPPPDDNEDKPADLTPDEQAALALFHLKSECDHVRAAA